MKRQRFGFKLWLIAVVAFFCPSGSGVAHIGFAISPSIVSFTAIPDTIQPGDSARLSWVTRGADQVTLEWSTEDTPADCLQHVAALPAKGSLKVHPPETTVYKLSCEANVTEQLCAPMTVLVSVN